MDTQELRQLFSESIAECREREAAAFDRVSEGAETEGLVLFGAGGLGRKTLRGLRSAGLEPLAFSDNNQSLWGQSIDGVRILPPSEVASRYGKLATFVITIWAEWAGRMEDQRQDLRKLGCQTVIPFTLLFWKFPALFLPHIQVDLPSKVHEQASDVLRCAELWADSTSYATYLAQVRWRLYSDFESLTPPVDSMYFPTDLVDGIRLDENCTFVDVGAYDGDTIADFVVLTGGAFRRVYAFEPDTANFASLQQRLARMQESVRWRITPRQQAVGDRNCLLSFTEGGGTGSRVGAGATTVECVTLDSTISEAPTYMKFDVEGFEPEALEGAREIITRYRPALAVCVYHIQDHLWKLPLLIHSFNPRYRFYLRPHGQVWETVCYAVPA
jgi:FkbM family methyltransferase